MLDCPSPHGDQGDNPAEPSRFSGDAITLTVYKKIQKNFGPKGTTPGLGVIQTAGYFLPGHEAGARPWLTTGRAPAFLVRRKYGCLDDSEAPESFLVRNFFVFFCTRLSDRIAAERRARRLSP